MHSIKGGRAVIDGRDQDGGPGPLRSPRQGLPAAILDGTMRALLSDGSGLTARQGATRLAAGGHHVEVLSPDPLCLCRFTRYVSRVHRVPAYGADPFG